MGRPIASKGWEDLVKGHVAARPCPTTPPAAQSAGRASALTTMDLEITALFAASLAPSSDAPVEDAAVSTPHGPPRRPKWPKGLTLPLASVAAFLLAIAFGTGAPQDARPVEPSSPMMLPATASHRASLDALAPAAARIASRGPALVVVTDPPGAKIEVAGVIRGRSPAVVQSPASERVFVRLRKPGFEVWTGVVEPNADGVLELSARLEALHREPL